MLTAVDVYDAASTIGRDCQLIISEHGQEIIQNLLPKVVSVLEELESCALYCESECEEIHRLQNLINDLRLDCHMEANSKELLDKNLERLEQSWYNESQQLLHQIATLEAENKELVGQLVSEVTQEGTEKLPEAPSVAAVVRNLASGRQPPAAMHLAIEQLTKDATKPLLMSSAEGLAQALTELLSETEERLNLTEQENRAADLQLIGRLKECVSTNHKLIRKVGLDLLEVNAAIDAAETEVCRLAHESGQLMSSRVTHRSAEGQLTAEKERLEAQLARCQNQLRVKSSGPTEGTSDIPKLVSPTDPPIHMSPWEGTESAGIGRLARGDSDGVTVLEVTRQLVHQRNEIQCRLIEVEAELNALKAQRCKEPDVEGPILEEPREKLNPNRQANEPRIKSILRKFI